MTSDKVKQVTATYRRDVCGSDAKRWIGYFPPSDTHAVMHHCAWMLDEIDSFVDAGRTDKAFRWLGFVQGVLWATHRRTIGEMKDDNRPEVQA